jgi:farnesyl diphosphate synthase
MAQTTKRADFEAIFPSLAQDILAHAKRYNLPANALEWFENVSPPFLIFTVLLDD